MIVGAAGCAAALIAMYVYEKSVQEEIEAMLQAALQEYRADSG